MRLTLRTLLAYIDEILEPKDAQEIGKRIEESEFASNLLHRIRDVTRRLRLGAPSVTERGSGLDPNTVAEYLDNALPDARVPDFEKVCLESDVHLAEVASCHQVLALVLGEPAEVDPASRQRMYQLPEVVAGKGKPKAAPPKLPGQAAGDGDHRDSVAAPPPAPPPRVRPPLPEYLQETVRKRRLWRNVACVVGVLLILVMVLAATGQLEPGSHLGQLFARVGQLLGLGEAPGPVAQAPAAPAPVETPTRSAVPEQSAPAPGLAAAPEPAMPATEKPRGGELETRPAAVEPVLPPGQPKAIARPAAAPEAAMAKPVEPSLPPGAPLAAPGAAETVPALRPDPGAGPSEANPLRPAVAEPPVPLPPKPLPTEAAGTAGPELRPMVPGEPKPPAPADAATKSGGTPAIAPAPAETVAKFTVPADAALTPVLLKLGTAAAGWERVARDGLLTSRDKLLLLPGYRASLLLLGNVSMELVDGTRVDLAPPDAQRAPGLAIDFGRLILRNQGATKEKPPAVRIHLGERVGTIILAESESAVAIQVSRPRRPGADPETQPSPRVADLYVLSGRIYWQQAGSPEPVAVSAPVRLTLNDRPLEAVAVQQFPKWIDPESAGSLEQRTAGFVERELQGRPSLRQGLRELVEHRQREVRWLAARALGYVGDFGPLVKGLDDPEQKQLWTDQIEQLREAVARSPETAAAVRTAMQEAYKEGGALYEMLWKYREDRLSAEDGAQLIRYLDHEILAFRVLAFLGSLKPITGLGLYYRPEDPPAKRQAAVSAWKKRLKPSGPAASATPKAEPPDAAPPQAPEPIE